MAQNYWAESYQWSNLYKEYDSLSTNASTATVALQDDHRKFDGYLKVATTTSTQEYQQILPDEKSQYVSTDNYFYVLGSPNGGYNMVINPIPASGASIHYSYWANAATLASPADVSMCPNPEFLVQKSLEYYWRAIDDARFQVAKADAETLLKRMLESELTKGPSYDNRILTYEQSRSNFRIGLT